MNCRCQFVFLVFVASVTAAVAAEPADSLPAAKRPDLLSSARWEYSTDKGITWSATRPARKKSKAQARAFFDVADPAQFTVLELAKVVGSDKSECTLNGQAVGLPVQGLTYTTLPAISATMLRRGANELTLPLYGLDSGGVGLFALTPKDLQIQTGPILGHAGNDFFTVSCRTNMPVPVTLTVSPQPQPGKVGPPAQKGVSQVGLFHRFEVSKLDPTVSWQYVLSVEAAPFRLSTQATGLNLIPPGQKLRFAAFGDTKKNLGDWSAVASAVTARKPDLIVHLGDMLDKGTDDALWDRYFFAAEPVRHLFATVPTFAVLGNHESASPLFYRFFCEPYIDAGRNIWRQEINGVLLVGINGAADWSEGGANHAALEKVLSQSRERFVFLFTHYPGYSSSLHGTTDDEGEPTEKVTRICRDLLIPLAQKHHVSALVTGHEHVYERSELPGLTQIVPGAAGASRRQKMADAEKHNPYSKVFASELNYAMFEIDGESCHVTAYTPDGRKLDKFELKPRLTTTTGAGGSQ